MKIRTFLKDNKDSESGLYPNEITIDGNLNLTAYLSWPSLHFRGRAFYLNLLRSHLQSNRRDMESLVMYREAIDAMIEEKMFRKSNENNDYTTEYDFPNMHNSACYLGAMLSRGAAAINHSLADHRSTATRHQELAQGITRTCYTASNRTKTGLPPYWIILENAFESSSHYYLR